jgi:hypothetical protein
VSDYLAHEGLEHAEKAHEHLGGTSDPVLRLVPVVAAVLAVCAGLSSLYGNRLSETMLLHAQEAVLDQTRAADTWNEYEANSLKAHVESTAQVLTSDPATRRQLHDEEGKYRKRQQPLMVEAKQLESERTAALSALDSVEPKKLDFDVATALFQISIVLASIAAMTKRSPLFFIGLVGGVIGLAFCVVGLLR